MVKLLKIIIFNIIFLFPAINLFADSITLKTGHYDFTDEATRDFYKSAFTAQLDYSFYSSPFVQLNILTGVYYTKISHSGKNYINYIYPLQISFISNLREQDYFITPYMGAGIGGYYTIDDAPGYNKSYKTFTYGYHYIFGLLFKITGKSNFIFELKRNIIMTHEIQEIVSSGINSLIGVQYLF